MYKVKFIKGIVVDKKYYRENKEYNISKDFLIKLLDARAKIVFLPINQFLFSYERKPIQYNGRN